MTPNILSPLRFAAALAVFSTALCAHAGSLSASSASSESVGSSSTSIEKSSDSSSAKDKVAQGQYQVLAIAAVQDQPDMLRVHLHGVAAAASDEFVLVLPREAVARGQLAEGQVIEAQHRAFGVAFAALDTEGNANPFFLVLDDVWHREIESRPVTL